MKNGLIIAPYIPFLPRISLGFFGDEKTMEHTQKHMTRFGLMSELSGTKNFYEILEWE
jgi:hypothetical protein